MIRRNYINVSEVTGATEDQVALAEQLIDDYVGVQDRFIKHEVTGKVTGSLSGKVVDENTNSPLFVTDNTYSHCVIEIIGGAGVGQSRVITASDQDERSVSFEGDAFSPALDATSVYRIYQLAKFPRRKDSKTPSGESIFYKYIPQAVVEATRAQTEFIIEMGEDFFQGEDSEMQSEHIGNYSYSRGQGQGTIAKMLSPRARTLLRGIKNNTGRLVEEQTTYGH